MARRVDLKGKDKQKLSDSERLVLFSKHYYSPSYAVCLVTVFLLLHPVAEQIHLLMAGRSDLRQLLLWYEQHL